MRAKLGMALGLFQREHADPDSATKRWALRSRGQACSADVMAQQCCLANSCLVAGCAGSGLAGLVRSWLHTGSRWPTQLLPVHPPACRPLEEEGRFSLSDLFSLCELRMRMLMPEHCHAGHAHGLGFRTKSTQVSSCYFY